MASNLYIITGTSKGLGRALVEELLADGKSEVIGVSRTDEKSNERFTAVQADLADIDGLVKCLDSLMPRGNYERVVLINNAGWIGQIAHLGTLDPKGIQQIHAVNTVAPTVLMNAFVERYSKSPAEKIVINISSGAARKAVDGWSGYCASKAALNQLSLVAEEESKLQGWGIRFVALAPGIVDTPMQSEIREASPSHFSLLAKFRSYKEQGELSSPSQTAKKIAYLIDNLEEFDGVILDVRDF